MGLGNPGKQYPSPGPFLPLPEVRTGSRAINIDIVATPPQGMYAFLPHSAALG